MELIRNKGAQWVAGAVVVLAAVFLWGRESSESEPVQLGTPLETTAETPEPRATEHHAQYIQIARSTLDGLVSGKGKSIQIALFDGEVVPVSVHRHDENGKKGAIIYGRVEGEPESRVNLSIVEDAIFGSIRLEDGRSYSLASERGGKYRLSLEKTTEMVHPGRPNAPKQTMIVNGEKIEYLPHFVMPFPNKSYFKKQMIPNDVWKPGLLVSGIDQPMEFQEEFVQMYPGRSVRSIRGGSGRPTSPRSPRNTPGGRLVASGGNSGNTGVANPNTNPTQGGGGAPVSRVQLPIRYAMRLPVGHIISFTTGIPRVTGTGTGTGT